MNRISNFCKSGFVTLAVAAVLATVPAAAEQEEGRAALRRDQDVAVVPAEAAEDMRHVLGDAIEAALDGDYEDFVDYLSEQDRERIGRFSEEDITAARDYATDYSRFWDERYGEEIDWDDNDDLDRVFNYPIRAVGAEMERVTVELPTENKVLRLVNEGDMVDSWRIDAPNNLSGPQLRMRLEEAMRNINANRSLWPDESVSAARNAASEILKTVAHDQ